MLVKDKTLLGMGCGQPNRVVSVFLAKNKAGEKAKGSVMASDAMFPFSDSVEQAAEAASPPSSSRAAPSATRIPSRPRTSTISPWSSPA